VEHWKPRHSVGLFTGGIGLLLAFCIYTTIKIIFPQFIDPYQPLSSSHILVSLLFALLVGVVAGFFAAQEERALTAGAGARVGAWGGGIAGVVMCLFGPIYVMTVTLPFMENLPFPSVIPWIEGFARFLIGFWEYVVGLLVLSALGGATGGYFRAASATAEEKPTVE
jgi:hypothetical protein